MYQSTLLDAKEMKLYDIQYSVDSGNGEYVRGQWVSNTVGLEIRSSKKSAVYISQQNPEIEGVNYFSFITVIFLTSTKYNSS